jgi:hypothetical protein
VPHRVSPARLEDVQKSLQVALRIGVRILNAVPHSRLRGEVDAIIWLERTEQLPERRAVRDVGASEPEVLELRQSVEARLLERRIVVGREVVDSKDLRLSAAFKQAAAYVVTDESGRAGHKDPHFVAFLRQSRDAR